jgi:hypothetical protein
MSFPVLSRLLSITLPFLAYSEIVAAQTINVQFDWINQFGTVGAVVDVVQAASSGDGGFYVAGSVEGTLPGEVSAGGSDVFVRRYDGAGNLIWTRQFGTFAADRATGISVDGSSVYVAGQTNGTLPGEVASGDADAFVRRYDADGSVVWTRQLGTAASDQALGISVDSTGVYVVGSTAGSLPGEFNQGVIDAFVRRYSSDGTELWTRQFGTSGSDLALGVAADLLGAFVVGSTGGTLPGQTGAGVTDAFVRHYDVTGAEIWTYQFGTFLFDQANSVSVNPFGVYVAGLAGAALPGQVSAGPTDAFVGKLDLNGTLGWPVKVGCRHPHLDAVAHGSAGLSSSL